MDCRPRWKIERHHLQRATDANQIHNAFHKLQEVGGPWSATRFGWPKQRFDQFPLFIAVTWVGLSVHISDMGQKPAFHKHRKRPQSALDDMTVRPFTTPCIPSISATPRPHEYGTENVDNSLIAMGT